MRTTLAIADDAFAEIQAYARDRGVSLGEAASELVRRGARYQLGVKRINGLPVFDAPEEFPIITTARVRSLAEDE